MKKKIFIYSLAIIQSIILASGLKAQVTVGSGTDANPGTILDIKSQASGADRVNANGGVALPRINLEKLTVLEPATTTTAAKKVSHTGLVVYNLKDDVNENLCEGVYVWDGNKWVRLHTPCGGDRCEYSIQSNVTPSLYYYFYCIDFYTDQDNAEARCKGADVVNGTSTYHLMTYQEFIETWNKDIVHYPLPPAGMVNTFFVNYNGWITLGVIKSDNTMEVLGVGSSLPGGPAIGSVIGGEHTVRCVKD